MVKLVGGLYAYMFAATVLLDSPDMPSQTKALIGAGLFAILLAAGAWSARNNKSLCVAHTDSR